MQRSRLKRAYRSTWPLGAVAAAALTLSACAGAMVGDADEVSVCHQGYTLVLPGGAVEAHLEHGDSMGACEG